MGEDVRCVGGLFEGDEARDYEADEAGKGDDKPEDRVYCSLLKYQPNFEPEFLGAKKGRLTPRPRNCSLRP